jgi:hypothetical protein
MGASTALPVVPALPAVAQRIICGDAMIHSLLMSTSTSSVIQYSNLLVSKRAEASDAPEQMNLHATPCIKLGSAHHCHHSCQFHQNYSGLPISRLLQQVRSPCLLSRQHRKQHRRHRRPLASSSSSDDAGTGAQAHQPEQADLNQLTTALNNAIAAEDYRAAARLRDRLRQLSGRDAGTPADWRALGIPEWLADRAERIGYRFPTGTTGVS